jgi:hypothetical protein
MKALVSHAICLMLFLSGCAATDQPSVSGTYRVEGVKAGGGVANGEAPVRVKLSSSGNVSEADLASIVSYVKIVAKREATKQQAMIAQQRARAIIAKMSPSQRARSRYIAVDTSRSALRFESQNAIILGAPQSVGPAPSFTHSVMVWDAQNQALVGNIVYDIKSAPPIGTLAKFESQYAVYVGMGM